jgi:hypothetical protein
MQLWLTARYLIAVVAPTPATVIAAPATGPAAQHLSTLLCCNMLLLHRYLMLNLLMC